MYVRKKNTIAVRAQRQVVDFTVLHPAEGGVNAAATSKGGTTTSSNSKRLGAEEQAQEKNAAFYLLDALTWSGTLSNVKCYSMCQSEDYHTHLNHLKT